MLIAFNKPCDVLDHRGSHFYLALYRAQTLTAQDDDGAWQAMSRS